MEKFIYSAEQAVKQWAEPNMTYDRLLQALIRLYGSFYSFFGLFNMVAAVVSLLSMQSGISMGSASSLPMIWLLSKDNVAGIFDLFLGIAVYFGAGRLAKWMAPGGNRPISFITSDLHTIVLALARFYLLTWYVYFAGLLLSSSLLVVLHMRIKDLPLEEALVLFGSSFPIVGLVILDCYLSRLIRVIIRTKPSAAV